MKMLKEIAYAPAEPESSAGHLLDLYLPEEGEQPNPLVIWTHGSAWLGENGREGAELVAERIVPLGYAVAGVSIRASWNARFPAQLHDIKAAIRWLRAHAAQHAIDPQRFGIMGDSSGGWTTAMAALTGGLPQMEGDVGVKGFSSWVRAAVPFYPPTDFLQMDAHMLEDCVPGNQIMGLRQCHADPNSPESLLVGCPIETCPEAVQRANPITYAGAGAPPMLILHGMRDPLVPYHQSLLLYEALSQRGAEVSLVMLPDAGHGPWDGFLTDPVLKEGATLRSSKDGIASAEQPLNLGWDTVINFFEKHVRGRSE